MMLAHTAAGAAGFFYVNLVGEEFDGDFADRASVNADGALLAVRADAGGFMPAGDAHVNFAYGYWRERAGGTVVHAQEPIAHDAGHGVDVDIWRPVAFCPVGVDLNALDRADTRAFAAAAAGFKEGRVFQCARGTKPGGGHRPDLRCAEYISLSWSGRVGAHRLFGGGDLSVNGTDLTDDFFKRLGRLDQGTKKLTQPGTEKTSAVYRAVFIHL